MAVAIHHLDLTPITGLSDRHCDSRRSLSCRLQDFSFNENPVKQPWQKNNGIGSVLERGRSIILTPTCGTDSVVHGGASDCRTAHYVALLRACAKNRNLIRGMEIHEEIVLEDLTAACFVALVSMYVKCGALAKAEELLLQNQGNVRSWTELIAAYTREKSGQDALNCFEQMLKQGLSPDAITFITILKACGSIEAVEKGEKFHKDIVRGGLLELNFVLGTALLDMYAKCGFVGRAKQLLRELPFQDVTAWSALIQGYVKQGLGQEALHCYQEMQREGLVPDAITFSCVLKACGAIRAVDEGKTIHDLIFRQGLLGNNIVLGTALVDMYAKCGDLIQAQQTFEKLCFRDVIAWNALITGYAQVGQGEQASKCYDQMQAEGLSPNWMTYTSLLKAYGQMGALEKGRQLHDLLVGNGLIEKDSQIGSALVDMYVKCGALIKAQQVLEGLSARNKVSWSTLIAGYAEHGQGEQAFDCYEKMKVDGFCPDTVTFIAIIKASSSIGAAERGMQIHEEVAKEGLVGNNIELGNALVDMYAKCGILSKAQEVLESLAIRDIVSWNSLIVGYAQHGLGEEILRCVERMQSEDLSPNSVTFLALLTACSHLGLIEEGYTHFVNMIMNYGLHPEAVHLACMVDLFERAGHLDKAVRMIEEMPFFDYSATWLMMSSGAGQD